MLLQVLQLRVVLPDGLHLVLTLLRAIANPSPPGSLPPVSTVHGEPVEGFGLLTKLATMRALFFASLVLVLFKHYSNLSDIKH